MTITKEEFWKGEDVQHDTKVCNKCMEEYPATIEYFCNRIQTPDGFSYECKACQKKERIKRRAGVGEKIEYDIKKTCSNCKKEYPASSVFFYLKKEAPDGLDYRCKSCIKLYRKTISHENNVFDKNERKVCFFCGREYSATPEYFYKDKSKKDGLSYKCKECDKDVSLKSQLMHSYGITVEEYDEMFITQDERCLICNNKSKKRLSVDHDHNTGKVRGLLCSKCNTGIGMFGDDYHLVLRASEYLKEHMD